MKLTLSFPRWSRQTRSMSPIFRKYFLIIVIILIPDSLEELKSNNANNVHEETNHIQHHSSSAEDIDYYEDVSNYEDTENPLLPKWGQNFSKNDTNEISEIERQEELESDAVYTQHRGKPKISKCCDFGEGLNAQGLCNKIPEAEMRRHHHWFPDRMIDFEINNWTTPDEADWNVTAPSTIKCQSHESPEVISDTNLFVIVNNGKLFLPQHNKDVPAGEFCVDLLIGTGRAVRSCFSKDELCRNSDCLRKCCPEGTMVEESSGSCYYHSSTSRNRFPNDKYNVIHGAPTCPYGQYKTPINGYFNIGPDGGLLTSTSLNVSFLNYCLDFFIEQPADALGQTKYKRSYISSIGNLPSSINDNKFDVEKIEDMPSSTTRVENVDAARPVPVLKAIMCFDSPSDAISKKRNSAGLISVPREMSITYGVAFVLSSVCIALAAFISWRLPELRSLHGKCQLSHLATLFALFLLLAIIHLGSDSLVDSTAFCTFLAVSLHTTTLSAFLWLNLLCVNIYLTFRSLRPPLAARRDENKRLLFLCVYAWGIPLAFCLFLFLLDRTPGRLEPMPRPQYGNHTCLISNRTAMFYYLYGPVGFLLLLNAILFCLTARELLCGLWRLDNSDSISFRRKSMGIVVAKLGIVMGMGWILDVLSWAVGNKPYIFYIADLFNGLQGVFMFLVLIWRKRVLEVLKLRKPSVIKDETLTARPFLLNPSKSHLNASGLNDPDASLVLSQDS